MIPKPITGIDPIRYEQKLEHVTDFVPLSKEAEQTILEMITESSLLWFILKHGSKVLGAAVLFGKLNPATKVICNGVAWSLDWLYKKFGKGR